MTQWQRREDIIGGTTVIGALCAVFADAAAITLNATGNMSTGAEIKIGIGAPVAWGLGVALVSALTPKR